MVCGPIRNTIEVEGKDMLEDKHWCIGWKYGLCVDKLMRLLIGSPS